jgi:hypothetical protein
VLYRPDSDRESYEILCPPKPAHPLALYST